MYVLDTTTLVYFFKGMGRVAERLLEHPPREIAIPAIVLFELETGIAKSDAPERRREQLNTMVRAVSIWPLGAEEARAAARIRARLERIGAPIGPMDTLIAGTALARGGTLVTHNMREFSRIDGLRAEDWF